MTTSPPDSIESRSEEIVEEFSLFDDWMGRYEHLIDLGKGLSPLDDAFRVDAYRVQGCQSQVWLVASREGACIQFQADSDAMITKGLVALLVRVFDGQPPADVIRADLSFLDRIGMREHLSSTRKNGLDAMHKRMRAFAETFAEPSEPSQ